MQIDFHHTTTYIVARDAGFNHQDAEIIAYASQYVDDATLAGPIHFDNGAAYNRINSAHNMIDLRNENEIANHNVWIPFHFLPGNGNMQADQNPLGSFINKIICTPDSPVAQEMLSDTILEQHRNYGLHRLGISLHVYADTWAHQGFAGVQHLINEVEHAQETDNYGIFTPLVGQLLRNLLDDTIPPLGHARAQIFPDMPFLNWQYKNGSGDLITRNNPVDFLAACDKMCFWMRRYLLKNPHADVTGLSNETRKQIKQMFSQTLFERGEDRHQTWLAAIRTGFFTQFSSLSIKDYATRGAQSWKYAALGSSEDQAEYHYQTTFLTSNWKLFHDALQAHRFNVIYNILPKYGICAA